MLIGLAEGSGPSDLMTKIARIRNAVGEDVKQVWQEEMANCLMWPWSWEEGMRPGAGAGNKEDKEDQR